MPGCISYTESNRLSGLGQAYQLPQDFKKKMILEVVIIITFEYDKTCIKCLSQSHKKVGAE